MASRRLSQLWTGGRWSYATKGDTRFAAERRLWRSQMTEMRRNLQNEELVVRRETYLAAREKKAAFDAEQARNKPSLMAELRKLEMKARLDLQREEADAARLVRREAAMEKEAFKRGAENKERLAWLEELQRDYSVDGSAPQTFSLDARKKRAFLTPENIDRQLTAMLVASDRSPIDKWAGRARESQKEEDEQQKEAMGGSRMADRDRPPRGGARGGAYSGDGGQVTAAERKVDLEAGLVSPGDAAHPDTGPEFKDRLRSTLASLSRPRAEAPPAGAQPSDADGDDGKAK